MLATNSEYGYAKHILKRVLGEDFEDYFDFISVATDKPHFWRSPERDFHAVDPDNFCSFKGPATKGKDFDFDNNKFLINGNADSIVDYVAKKL